MTGTHEAAVHEPSRPGSAVAVAAAVVAVVLVADARAQLLAIGVELAGLVVLAVGIAAWRRDAGVPEAAVAVAGAAIALGGVALGVAFPSQFSHRLELLPGAIGLALIALGLVPVRAAWSRRLVSAGTAAVVVGILTSGVLLGVDRTPLLVALVAAVVAWDVGERAINLGEQVGRDARTGPVELAAGGGTLAVGGVAIGASLAIDAVGTPAISLAGLALLLAAAITLTVALHQ